ncbi:uncharacterized protein K460DRAFT_367848 [Cucurbitaria berberidis CBS 394.84]|uniref:Uncharacterized protein n=1 Tax=Cucurbitaria berberidis CBS 394.84 TaxID=1168544 RepID=A0A9P4GBP9_9PLEO|nr:uncharacterized protein K460DRAFT_367848 [Cucurbitaria berberidis CBS 394.84]KAF1842908.1 hypothetical protein K460DRAFT_367848 [Cucurbitaria berberidis CBS 394.84]
MLAGRNAAVSLLAAQPFSLSSRNFRPLRTYRMPRALTARALGMLPLTPVVYPHSVDVTVGLPRFLTQPPETR